MSRILVVDDDASYARSLSKVLGRFGFETMEAGTGSEALKFFRQQLPDLALLDWHLGSGLSGLDILKALKRHPATRKVPVVVISAIRFTPEDEREAFQNGASLFLHKAEIDAQPNSGNHFLRHLCALLPGESPKINSQALAVDLDINQRSRQRGNILIVDDDPEFVGYVRTVLSPLGYQLKSASSGREAMVSAASFEPDLAILDVELGDASGLEICQKLKRQPKTRKTAVMIITGHALRPYWIASIRFGADLFMPKTITPDQLSSCVEALLARAYDERNGNGMVRIGALAIDPVTQTITVSGRAITTLTTKLFDLAYLLATHRDRILERHEIMRRLKMTNVRDNEINVLMHILRRKIGPEGKKIFRTIRGIGYRFNEDGCRQSPTE